MRKLLTISLMSLLVLLSVSPAMALDFESKSFYGAGTLVLPMGNFGDMAGTGFGALIGISVPHTAELTFRGEVGYIKFGGKDLGTFEYSSNMIPFMVLGEYHWDPASKMYAVGGIGMTRVAIDVESEPVDFGFGSVGGGDFSTSSTELGLVAGIGYLASEKFSIEGRYNLVSDANSISAVGVYHF